MASTFSDGMPTRRWSCGRQPCRASRANRDQRTSATLEDLSSKNGTIVRGQAVTAPVQLADGDEIRIGSFVLSYRTVSAKGSTKSAAGS